MSALRLEGIGLWLGERQLLAIAHASVDPGGVLAIMGPSGAGKSALLAHLAGFLDPVFRASGRLWLGGEDITALPAPARRLGLLFQDDLLFPHLSVGQNIAFGLPRTMRNRAARAARVAEALAEVDLAGFAERDPATLSGGQRQRAALARTLAAAPRVLLLDEPFSRLDVPLREQMRGLVFGKARHYGLPCLIVTHDVADVPPGAAIIRL
jgi:putative thiamine transport system ATP-binding protein